MKEFTIRTNEENQRFDKYLKKLLPNAAGSFLYKMLRKKNITLNGKKAEGSELLKSGDRVAVFFSDETFDKFSGGAGRQDDSFDRLAALPLGGITIVYEDADILIADKPFNMLSQKTAPDDITANERLLGYLIREGRLTREMYATFHPSVCNRLDRNTTGLILMGITLKGSQELSAMLKARTIQKYYLAAVAGEVTTGEHLKGFLAKDEKTNRVRITAQPESPGAKPVETTYEPVCFADGATLLVVHLITGKTHQIRAHLASAGHPVIGDPKYGSASVNRKYREENNVKAQLLHAYRLEFPDGRVFETGIPSAFYKVSKAFRL
jgi:23S rRNA pseudouridine955/2504/2580 synthase